MIKYTLKISKKKLYYNIMYIYDIKCVDFSKSKIIKNWTNEKKNLQLQCYIKWLGYNKYDIIEYDIWLLN
jgi:hypothetical protein